MNAQGFRQGVAGGLMLLAWAASLIAAEPASAADVKTINGDGHVLRDAVALPEFEYPLEARRSGVTGDGLLRIEIDTETGIVSRVEMAQSTGSHILDEASLAAGRKARFKPNTLGVAYIPVTYTLDEPPRHRAGIPGASPDEFSFLPPNQVPVGGLVVEAQVLEAHPERALLLWMKTPEVHPIGFNNDEAYTCPNWAKGSHFRGPTRISLVDTKAAKIINTIEIKPPSDDDGETLDIPYAIRKGKAYRVEGDPAEGEEVRPKLLWLRDYNGDGKALEFALFYSGACVEKYTTIFGYSEKQDRVIQYAVELKIQSENKPEFIETSYWMDQQLSEAPPVHGLWHWVIDFYRGECGDRTEYQITYNQQRELYEGTLKSSRSKLGPCGDEKP